MKSAFLLSLLLLTAAARSQAPKQNQNPDGLRALDGEWIYVEDRTAGRPLEQQGPPMSAKFSMRVEEGAVILNGHGSGHRDVRVALDGSITEVKEPAKVSRYRGAWKDGTFEYQTEFVRVSDNTRTSVFRKEFRMTKDGLQVRVNIGQPADSWSVGLYRHPQDIALPAPAKAAIADMAWLAGAWGGTRGAEGATTIEERWSPPGDGAMSGTSRTVTRGKLTASENLRIVERDRGLVYIAQPGGAAPTEFVLTELTKTRAVFDNPRHDYPKRITYELSAEGALRATIGFTKGGTPRRFDFKREAKSAINEPK